MLPTAHLGPRKVTLGKPLTPHIAPAPWQAPVVLRQLQAPLSASQCLRTGPGAGSHKLVPGAYESKGEVRTLESSRPKL